MRFLLILILALSACAPRQGLLFDASAAARNPVKPVFIATTRAQDLPGDYGTGRHYQPAYARYDIAMPPNRQPGQIDYRTKTIDPESQFLATGVAEFPSGIAFRTDLTRALRDLPASDREVVIYVHGFNNTFAEGVLRIAQLTQDNGFKGVAAHYSWPSAENPLNYAYDRDSVLFARDGLEAMIAEVRAAGPRRIVLVGHSVGSGLIMEALRQMAIARPGSVAREIDGVILFSPDIDIDVFHAQAARIGKLPRPFGIFVSQRDRALSLSARLTGQGNRLGNISDLTPIGDLEVTVVDVTGFSSGMGHFTAGDSPDLIKLFAGSSELNAAFEEDSAGRTGILPGTILTVQNVTAIVLSPVTNLLNCASAVNRDCGQRVGEADERRPGRPPPGEGRSPGGPPPS